MQRQASGSLKARLWGEFRLLVVGGLLASPPEKGELREALKDLADKDWRHPLTAEAVRFSFGTIEGWYYTARRNKNNPVEALSTGRRQDQGHGRFIAESIKVELLGQYQRFPDWTVKLHADNLRVLVQGKPDLGLMPSYSTLRRYMKQNGLHRKKKIRRKRSPGLELAQAHLEKKEVRSYEAEHVGGLWHGDFHQSGRKVQNEAGKWIEVHCLAIHDDHSRLACHVQWYSAETAKNLIHGISQAILKRGRPWMIMTDNGGAMKADEFTEGLSRIGIIHTTTLPYSPYQNGKTERFWAVLEGRLMAMLKDTELNLKLLNEATLAWVEGEYNREKNSEIQVSPYERYTSSPDVSRSAPTWEDLRMAFRMEVSRGQRRMDGTVTVDGRRFEVPSAYRGMERVRIRYARWDLSLVHLVDGDGKVLARLFPVDKSQNASGLRRNLSIEAPSMIESKRDPGLPPLLAKLMADFAETGLPSPYIPEEEKKE